MKKNSVMWIIRREGGTLQGPVGTEDVLRQIREGVLGGSELIARYPDGQWTFISREPQFYETLMEALEGAARTDQRKVHKIMSEETIFMPPPPEAVKNTPLVPTAEEVVPKTPEPVPPSAGSQVIELKKITQLEKERIVKITRKPVIAIVIAVVVIVFLLLPSGESTQDKITLLAPGKSGSPLPEAEVKKRYQAVLKHVEKDSFEDNLEAQNKLVSLVEGSPSSLEIRSILCLVYKELWPFAKQDANDQKTVAGFSQSTRVLDVTSPYGSFCEIVRLLTAGRYREARGSVDNLLENYDSFSLRPVMYTMKAEVLENDKDYQIAARYYEKSIQDWDAWVKPKVRLAFVHLQMRDYPRAAEWFRAVLKNHPTHKAAKLGLGFTEFYGFHQNEGAAKLLSSALNSGDRVPRSLEGEGWQVYAEVLLASNQKSDALRAAEKAYKLNPNNEVARQLVLRLGGSDKRKKSGKEENNELILLGDQYVRQGDCLSAQAEFKAAFDMDNSNGTAAMKAAKCLWQLNQSYEAVEWLNKAIRADNKLISAYVLQSDYLAQRYDFSGAAQSLTNAARIAPGNHEILRGMALLEYRKNNMQGAINYALRAMKIYDADIDTYILLSKANLAMAQSIHSSQKKDLDRRDNAFKDSVRYATKAVELDSSNPEAQIAYARMLAATNGVDAGVAYLQELIKKYAYSFEYRLALAEVYRESERWGDARHIYNQVADADPRNKKAWIGLGEALRATGFNEKALKAFLSAAIIDPTDGEALFQAGKLYFETSKFEEALQQFVRVKGMNANFPKANYYAGRAAFALQRFDDALKFVRDEKRLNPNLADSYILNAEIHSSQGAYGECASEYAHALKLRPAGADIYVRSAECYRKAGSLEIAETMLTLAKERESGYPDLYKELGALFEKKGDAAAARQSYRNYLELAPNASDRKDIEQRIARLGG
ncbi:MAG: tetratricopeptide repeat protein [Bdellovibrionaceae bacterium]|nr:tetratricopeptide repeat protein [Pseudobdellovibrionaceae bacterium]MBX3033714.1 tetratricopeptide repeat protein [Pseudobdellovibrionaceae bacterium]